MSNRQPEQPGPRTTMRNLVRAMLLLVLMATLGASGVALARGFRAIAPIASPDASMALPEGAEPVANPAPIPRKLVEGKLKKIIERWNSPTMAQSLAENFYDKERLLNAVTTAVPQDAKLVLQSVQSIRTVQQFRTAPTDSAPGTRTSIVSAVARTQLEYNSANGFVRLPGTNEFILKVTEVEQR
ncbi:MAG: hypothetical protein ACI8W3_002510 [Myxococcota bacterium]|jgi:hypothetical protein